MRPTTTRRFLNAPVRAVTIAFGLAVAVLLLAGGPASAQQGVLPDGELARLAVSAKSPQDHARLAAHYAAHAAEHEADAKLHERLGAQYEKTAPQLSGEARHYAAHSTEAAEALRSLAKIHEGMAKGK